MCAEHQENEIDVFESRRFEKAMSKLTEEQQRIVDDEIDRIIADPLIGEQKRGDLSYLRVHKFYVEKAQCLLGYSWVDKKLALYLLAFGTHENFYDEQKKHRKQDLKLVG